MRLPPGFLLRIARATNAPEGGAGMMSIIIRRPYGYVEEELRRAFEGQEDVKVIVDSRYRECDGRASNLLQWSAAKPIGEAQGRSSSKY